MWSESLRTEAPTSSKPGDKAVIISDGRMVGWIGGSCSEASIRREAQRAIASGEPRLVRIEPESNEAVDARPGEVVFGMTCPSGGTLEIFLEPHLARPRLVVGGSPAARMLSRLGATMGFRTCEVGANLDLSGCDIGPDSWVGLADLDENVDGADTLREQADAALYVVPPVADRRRLVRSVEVVIGPRERLLEAQIVLGIGVMPVVAEACCG
jgi:xanthine/CO dehydrogenase XdhC/CoxF family maturation factor